MSEIDRINEVMPIVDKKSPTMCLAKWHHTTIYFNTGETHSCYHPPPHKIDIDEIKNNPSAIHNTRVKKMEREQMFEGKKPSGCQYCWNIEDLGKDQISDRHIRNASIFTKDRWNEVANNPSDKDINPEYIELSFSNECQMKCGYCHPKASSSYYNEIKKYGPYLANNIHRQDIDWFKNYTEEDNPFLEAWWKWWPEVSKTLNILRITGGEPLMHKSTWRLFESLEETPMPKLELNINSNLGIKEAMVQRMIGHVNNLTSSNKIKKFKLYTSLDTWTNRAEYIRNGLSLELWEKNLDSYLTQTNSPVSLMITFNILAVSSFKTLLEKILEWRIKYNKSNQTQWQILRFDTPYLKEPLHYDIRILPDSYLQYLEGSLEFMKQNCSDTSNHKFSTMECKKFERVVEHFKGNKLSSEQVNLGKSTFYKWFMEHDRRRNTNLIETFPEMFDFIADCSSL